MLLLSEFGKFILKAMKTAIDKFSGVTIAFENMSNAHSNGLFEVTFSPEFHGLKKV